MTSQASVTQLPHGHLDQAQPLLARLPRVWPPLVLLGIFWAVYSLWRWTELGISLGFLGWLLMLAVGTLAVLLFAVWWLAASRVGWSERLAVFGTAVFGGVGAAFLSDK
jgi:hypothetical protein